MCELCARTTKYTAFSRNEPNSASSFLDENFVLFDGVVASVQTNYNQNTQTLDSFNE